MKIRPVGGELFRADGQTDRTKITVVFRKFANAPKNSPCIPSRPLTLVIRIVLALRENFSRIMQNYFALKLPATGSSTIQSYGF